MRKSYYFIIVILFVILNSSLCLSYDKQGTTTDLPKVKYEVIPNGEILKPFSIFELNFLEQSKRGVTTSGVFDNRLQIGGSITSGVYETKNITKQADKILTDFSGWLVIDSFSVHTFLPAGKNLGVKFNKQTKRLEIINPNKQLTDIAIKAVNKSPKWLRVELTNTLSNLPETRQNELAALINNADDPIIDEIAFSIAYSSVTFLNSIYCYPQMFVENAKLLYSHDSDLKFVEIVDHGTSKTNENYYSSVKYWKIDSTRGKIQVEIPRDIYYMDIVHPKITDEFSTYIDPASAEPNYQGFHINNIAPPPNGVFWRDFLYNHTEEKIDTAGKFYKILKDLVSNCDILWEDKKDSSNQAVRAITDWVKDVMTFTSKTERPHEPVRIYRLHIGRCGEHEDLTAAAARACLIPCRGIEAMSIDHVWNEFWDEKWETWEPTNRWYKMPLAYQDWSGGIGSTVSIRSDGVCFQETDRYVPEFSTYSFYARDPNNEPIDGARVMTYKKRNIDGKDYIFPDNYGITDNDGKYTFTLGHGNTYYIRLETSLGNFPAADNTVAMFADNSAGGRHYDIAVPPANQALSNSKTTLKFNEISAPADNIDDFVLKVTFSAEKQVINWGVLWNDQGNCVAYNQQDNSKVNFFSTDEANYNKCLINGNFNAFLPLIGISGGDVEFHIPKSNDWYSFLNNSNCLSNSQLISATFVLYGNALNKVNESEVSQLLNNQVFPNPFNKVTNIKFSLENPSIVSLKIYNIHGELVKTLIDGLLQSGEHSIQWLGENDLSEMLNSGIYYYQLISGEQHATDKIVLIR